MNKSSFNYISFVVVSLIFISCQSLARNTPKKWMLPNTNPPTINNNNISEDIIAKITFLQMEHIRELEEEEEEINLDEDSLEEDEENNSNTFSDNNLPQRLILISHPNLINQLHNSEMDKLEKLKLLKHNSSFDNKGIEPNKKQTFQQSPLEEELFIYDKYSESVKVDLEVTDDEGNSLLNQEILNINLNGAKILIENNANVQATNNKRWTPLHCVASLTKKKLDTFTFNEINPKNLCELAKLLLLHDAKINALDKNKETPLNLTRIDHALFQFLSKNGGKLASELH